MTEVNNRNVWTVSEISEEQAFALSNEINVSPFLAKILLAKGFDTKESALDYLNSGAEQLGNPFELPDMQKAVDRIKKALQNNEKILVYGDYDVDGITSVAVLLRYLSFKGAQAQYYIPQRINEGYGLNKAAIGRFCEQGIKLIITVDSGITAHEEVEYANECGIDVVITDHHECREELPSAYAVVNPHRHDSTYPFCDLAGVGVVFKLVCALEDNKNIQNLCKNYCDIVALGTVADVMPIVGENRIIVKLGLKQLENTKNLGLAALTEQSFSERGKSKRKSLSASSIGFGLAPRINAAGRIGDVNKALELLITDNKAKAEEIASYLCAVNRERQVIENNIFLQAVERIENQFDFENDRVIVLESDSWHIGVIGIVASKLTERYKLPSILISVDENLGKGSCRSVKGFNINEALCACGKELVKYGGHELAAGLTVNKDNIENFKRAINEYAKNTFDFSSVCNYIDADFEVEASDITVANAVDVQKLEPFGLMNPVPMFCLRDVVITEIYSIGEGKHLKLTLEKDCKVITALYFGMSKENFPFVEGDTADFMGNIDLNDFRGNLSVQLLVKDVRPGKEQLSQMQYQSELFTSVMYEGGKCPVEFIPDIKQFRAAFLYLRRDLVAPETPKTIDLWHTAKKIAHEYSVELGAFTLSIILLVFDEMKIADVSALNVESAHLQLNKTDGKVNLEDSKLLINLKNS